MANVSGIDNTPASKNVKAIAATGEPDSATLAASQPKPRALGAESTERLFRIQGVNGPAPDFNSRSEKMNTVTPMKTNEILPRILTAFDQSTGSALLGVLAVGIIHSPQDSILPDVLLLCTFDSEIKSIRSQTCGILSTMDCENQIDYSVVYARFHQPLSAVDCGRKCAPYNQYGIPFCCDTRHAVPSAYNLEWEYLQCHTDLWQPWHAADQEETDRLNAQTPPGQVLIACLGHMLCQRQFRAITCRAFPFFPYITLEKEFIGLSYYWEYEDRCWVISHLDQVSTTYVHEFMTAYETIFQAYPEEIENFRYHSSVMRRSFSRRKRAIPLLHRNGWGYKVSPSSGRMRRIPIESLPEYGPYKIVSRLAFPGE